jgi:hypothetical protein
MASITQYQLDTSNVVDGCWVQDELGRLDQIIHDAWNSTSAGPLDNVASFCLASAF